MMKSIILTIMMLLILSCGGNSEDNIMPSYSGIRPLIKDCDDFLIEKGMFDGNILVDILGYASPGLTSCLATANYVRKLLDEF